MPYNNKSPNHNARAWAKKHPDEVNLDDYSIDPEMIDNRDDNEKAQGYIGNFIQGGLGPLGDHLLAAGGVVSDQIGYTKPLSKKGIADDYQRRLEEVRAKHERYRKLENDWSVGNIASGALGMAASLPMWGAVAGKVGSATSKVFNPSGPIGRGLKGALDLGLTSAAVMAPGHAADQAAAVNGPDPNLEDLISGRAQPKPTVMQGVRNAVGETAMDAVLGTGLGVATPAANRVLQRGFQMLRNPANKAARAIAERMLTSGKSAAELEADVAAAAKGGKPVAMVDVAPEDVRSVGTASGRMPGGKDRAVPALNERQAGQSERIGNDVADAAGSRDSFYKTMDQLSKERAEAARPLYEKAFSQEPISSPKIVEITNRPSGKQAINAGLKLAQDEGIPLEELVVRDSAGNITGYTTKALHYAKMGLDDMIEAAKRSGDNSAARAYTIMKNDLLSEMDRLNPHYAEARQIYSGHSAHSNALEAGREASRKNLHPDQIASEMADMSQSEQEFYRKGFMQHQLEIVENSPNSANAALRITGKSSQRARLKQILGPHYDEFMQKMELESKMNRTYVDVTKGSQTAERLAEQHELDTAFQMMEPGWGEALSECFRKGSIGPLLHKFGGDAIYNLTQGMTRQARGEVVRMMYSTDPAEVRAAIKLIGKEMTRAEQMQQLQRELAGYGAGRGSQIRGEQPAAVPSSNFGQPVDLGDF